MLEDKQLIAAMLVFLCSFAGATTSVQTQDMGIKFMVMVTSSDVSGVSKTTFTLTNFLYSSETEGSSISWRLKGVCGNMSSASIPSIVFNGDYACNKSQSVIAASNAVGAGNNGNGNVCVWQPFDTGGIAAGVGNTFSFQVDFETVEGNNKKLFSTSTQNSVEFLDNASGKFQTASGSFGSGAMTNAPQTIMLTTSGNSCSSVPNFNATYTCHLELWRITYQHK